MRLFSKTLNELKSLSQNKGIIVERLNIDLSANGYLDGIDACFFNLGQYSI